MKADALAQYLVWKQWPRWFLVHGSHPEDKALAAAYQRAAERFGAKIVEVREFEDTGGARRTLPILVDFGGLAYSTARFNLKFTRHAAAVHLDWRPHDAPKSDPIAVELAPDRIGATATFVLRTGGVLRLVLVRDVDGKKLRTETAVTVSVSKMVRPMTSSTCVSLPISMRAARRALPTPPFSTSIV